MLIDLFLIIFFHFMKNVYHHLYYTKKSSNYFLFVFRCPEKGSRGRMQEVEARSNVRDQHCGSSSSGSSVSSGSSISSASSTTSSNGGSVRDGSCSRNGGNSSGYLAEHRAFLPPPPPERYLPPPAPAPPDPYDRYLLHNYIQDRYIPANIDRYDR